MVNGSVELEKLELASLDLSKEKKAKPKRSFSRADKKPVSSEKIAEIELAEEKPSVEAAAEFVHDDDLEPVANEGNAKPMVKTSVTVALSKSLLNKLNYQAGQEGINLEDLIIEYLSESVVLRAWEILEKKAQMRNNPSQNNNKPNNNNANNQQNRRGGKPPRGLNQTRYNNIMDDKANFIDYVRSQEKFRR